MTTLETYETFEGLGPRGNYGIEVLCEWRCVPGEPMVRYYADGSGYPGCDPVAELIGIKVTAAWSVEPDVMVVRRNPRSVSQVSPTMLVSRPSLLDSLARRASHLLSGVMESAQDRALEAAAERWDEREVY